NTAGHALALAEAKLLLNLQAQRDACQGITTDQVRPQPAQLALGEGGKPVIQEFPHHQAQYGVAEELQAFVVGCTDTAVRERQAQQPRIAKPIAAEFGLLGTAISTHLRIRQSRELS